MWEREGSACTVVAKDLEGDIELRLDVSIVGVGDRACLLLNLGLRT